MQFTLYVQELWADLRQLINLQNDVAFKKLEKYDISLR